MTFSDATNPTFPTAQEVAILTGTKTIVLTCNLPECVWKISDDSDTISVRTYVITEIYSYNRTFSLMRETSNGINYTTAHINIHAQINDSTFPTDSALLFPIIIVVLVILFATIAIINLICIILCMMKRRSTKTTKRPKPSGFPGYENMAERQSPQNEFIDLQVIQHPGNVYNEDTSLTGLDPDIEGNSTYANPYEKIPKEEGKKFVSVFIPINEFTTTYQQYMETETDEDSVFSVEFSYLKIHSKINTELENENSVILDSPYFDCSHVNASYINDCQFIACTHPTKETHRDFLQMIYQTEASMVIMLTTRKEKAKMIGDLSNRVCYWPKKDEPIHCEPFVTTLINSTETTTFIKHEICLENTLERKKHSFTQCISTIWNEDSTITETSSAVNLLNRILKQLQDNPTKSIIIHCKDGCSKTGIFLTAINSVKELTLRKTVNIFNTVKNLRRQRMKMVPTLVSIHCVVSLHEYIGGRNFTIYHAIYCTTMYSFSALHFQ